MASKSDVDFGKTAKDYARHRAGFPPSFFERLRDWVRPGTHALDLGTGTGTLARGLARLGATVTGLDPSPALMNQARELDREAGVKVDYLVARAESVPLADAGFDLISAGQCWHWFEQDRVLAQIRRLLKPGGRLLVAYFDWLREPGGPVDLMYELQAKHNPSWKDSWPLGFYPQAPGDLNLEGFRSEASFRYDEDVSYTHEAWRGRIRAYAGIGGSLPADAVEAFDREFAERLRAAFPQQPMLIPHKIWAEVWRP